MGTEHLGRLMVAAGLGMAAVGGVLWAFSAVPGSRLGRLPGDFAWGGDGFRVYFPFATMLLLSLGLTGLMALFRWFSR